MPTTSRSQQPAEEPAQAPDPRDARIAELESQLAEAQRPAQAAGPVTADSPPVRLKVELPHSELHYAGHIIGAEFTEVPASVAAALMAAAADAGVTLTQDLEG